MIDHITFGVSDFERSIEFYDAAFTPLGVRQLMNLPTDATGGQDNGGLGVRPHYHPDYYGAFVLDPDGHNIEAVCHSPG